MASLNQVFQADQLPVSESNFDPLPAGWYQASISKVELKNTKSGTGSYINVQYSILGPTHQGRVVFGMINISNQNPKAEEIGRQQLGELMRAIGLARVEDTDQLIGGNLSIKLDVKEDDYGIKNNVKAFKSNGAAPSAPKAAPQATASAAPPWAKK